jgi:hypothetical protein
MSDRAADLVTVGLVFLLAAWIVCGILFNIFNPFLVVVWGILMFALLFGLTEREWGKEYMRRNNADYSDYWWSMGGRGEGESS